ncbi:hypothetical protein C0992_009296 [Termitomyces sp. T32_za158]|nr:hypothetical protein C0992_009296 [Termitomyces sp. T32_za158]
MRLCALRRCPPRTGDRGKGKGSGGGPLRSRTTFVRETWRRGARRACCKVRARVLLEWSGELRRDVAGFEPGYDATVVRLLRAHGADVLGKTNCDEFGMGSMNVYSVHGPVLNPHGTPAAVGAEEAEAWTAETVAGARVAGGSSGGSAAAVAAGMCRVALGTDTGGSTRLPASYCGVVGLKPSYGLLSRWGVVAFADSLDCVGVFGADVGSVREVFGVLDVYDARDPTSAPVGRREAARGRWKRRVEELGLGQHGGRLDGLRVGVPQEYFPREMTEDVLRPVRKTLRGLKERGAVIVPVSLPNTRYALSAYYVLASAEASSNLARYDGVQYGLNEKGPGKTAGEMYAWTRSAGFGGEVQRRILLGTYALGAGKFDNYFLQAQRVRELVRGDFARVLGGEDGVDVLVHASAVGTAPRMGEGVGAEGYVQDVLTVGASLGGLPGLSVPVAGEEGWPVGVSVVGGWGSEEILFIVGEAVGSSSF